MKSMPVSSLTAEEYTGYSTDILTLSSLEKQRSEGFQGKRRMSEKDAAGHLRRLETAFSRNAFQWLHNVS